MHENVRKNSLASRLINPFLVVCAVLVLAPWAGAYWSIFDQRDQAFEANVRQAARQVQNIENRILDLFNYSDNYLKSVRRTYLQEGGLPAVRAYMRAVPLDRTILSHITIIGPDGGPLSVSGHKLKPGVTAKDRAYFKFQQAATGDEVYLSTPRRGRNSDKFLVRLVRRITLADGKFGGVIFAAMEVKKFTHFFETLKVGPDSVVNLVGVDKTLRARSGYDLGEDAPTLDRSALWEHLKIANTGAFTETSVIDGLSRYYAFRQLDAYPLIVSIGVPTASLGLLDPKSIAQQISIAFLLSLVIVGALLMSWRERFASRRLSDEVKKQTAALRHEIVTRRSTEFSLRESERRFRNFTEASADWFWEMDENLRFSYFSENFEKVTGVPPQKLLGKTRQESGIPDVDPKLWRRHLDDLIMHRQFRGFEHPRELPEGRIVHLSINGVPVFGQEGNFIGFRGTGSDITARKEAESELRRARDDLERRVLSRTKALQDSDAKLQQAQKMEAVGQLTGGVAHDFNNLLSVIIGNLDFMIEPDVSESELKSLAESALHAAERGAELTHRLLAFSRKQALRPEITDINELVSGVRELLNRTLGESIKCEFVYQTDLPTINIDSVQLESSLVNLAVNARHAMPDGGSLRVETSLVMLDEDMIGGGDAPSSGQYIGLSVSDTGEGMSPEVLSQVFEPFFTTKPVGMGSGLGFSMVHGFIKQSDGHVSINSEVGVGTTVRLYFPVTGAILERPDVEVSTITPLAGGEEIILVVEDDDDLRKIATSIIAHLGYSVLVAADGPTAVQVMDNAARIDLVFTDVVLPNGMNGAKIAEYAQMRHPGIKVLYTLGYSQNIIVPDEALENGVELLSKPYRRADLAKRISDILEENTR